MSQPDGMEDLLMAKLAEYNLQDCVARLADIGVHKVSDISFLKDMDLKEAGLNIVQIRKLQFIAMQQDEQKITQQKEDKRTYTVRIVEGDAVVHSQDDEEPPADRRMSDISYPGQVQESDAELQESDTEGEQVSHSPTFSNWARVSPDGKYIEVMPLDHHNSTQRRRTSEFWSKQMAGRPMRLIFVRHGESEANVNRTITSTVPDHMLHLTADGRKQALEAGERLKELIGDETVKFIVSPYVRTRETLNGILRAWGPLANRHFSIKEDVRIREQEYGNFDDPDIGTYHKEKRKFGAFYYRFPAGESPADCYDRASLFLESMYRSWIDNRAQNQVVVCHGMMILVTLMRLLRLPIMEFDNLDSLKNCEFVVLERPEEDAKYSITCTWASGQPKDARGLRRKPQPPGPPLEIWDGSPDAPLLTNKPVRETSK